jgi:hypothetical protein
MDFMYKREDAFTLSFSIKDVIASVYVNSMWVYLSNSSKQDFLAFVGGLKVFQGYFLLM